MTRFNVLFFDDNEQEHDCVVQADDAVCALAVVLYDHHDRIASDSAFAVYPLEVSPPPATSREAGDLRARLAAHGPHLTPRPRAELEARFGADDVWDEARFAAELELVGIEAPCAAVRRRSDGKLGTVMFQDGPRLYFHFTPASHCRRPAEEEG